MLKALEEWKKVSEGQKTKEEGMFPVEAPETAFTLIKDLNINTFHNAAGKVQK